MKYAIRALGWVTTILWILVILFSATVVYSAMQVGITPGEPQVTASDGTIITSIPFSVNNTGFYDISNLNITTQVTDKNGIVISNSTTFVPLIQKGSVTTETHNVSLSLNDVIAKNLTYMFINDTVLSMDMFVALTYANAIPLKISLNTTMPWGAPFYNLSIGEISVVTPQQVNVSLRFENHAFFVLNGNITVELVDSSDQLIGAGKTSMYVFPQSIYEGSIEVAVTGDPKNIVKVRLYFDTDLFSFGPVVIPIA